MLGKGLAGSWWGGTRRTETPSCATSVPAKSFCRQRSPRLALSQRPGSNFVTPGVGVERDARSEAPGVGGRSCLATLCRTIGFKKQRAIPFASLGEVWSPPWVHASGSHPPERLHLQQQRVGRSQLIPAGIFSWRWERARCSPSEVLVNPPPGCAGCRCTEAQRGTRQRSLNAC